MALLRVDWDLFGRSVRAHLIANPASFAGGEKTTGISHARMHAAAQGKPVGTEIFLTLCYWMPQDPLWFCIGHDGSAFRS